MIQRAWDYIKLNMMIEKGDRIVVGVSGGADSVCLLYVLLRVCNEMEATIVVVHVNHGIRGEEADQDELYVKELCRRWNLEYYSYSYLVKEIAKELSLSEEEAGRKVRYEAFMETCLKKECNKIAIAHNKNDNAETMLFHLFRGSGMRGMSGIEPRRMLRSEIGEVTVIRPLLFAERKEIEEYLSQEGIEYRIDSTNLTEDYTRNKIRNRILAYAVSEINSGAVHNIGETAAQLREASQYIESNVNKRYMKLVKQEGEVFCVSANALQLEEPIIQKGIIMQILERLAGKRKDMESKHVEAVRSLLDKQVGKIVHLPYSMIAEREYEEIRFYCNEINEKSLGESERLRPVQITIPGRVYLPQFGKVVETELISYKKNECIPKSSCIKWFDYDKIENAVEIRTRKEGDFLQINAFGGRKKLKDYFIDNKIPKKLRDSQLLITDGNHVMWIPGIGERMSEKYKVEDSTTKILLMKMIDLEDINYDT